MTDYLDAIVLESNSAARMIGPCDRCNSAARIAALVIFKGQYEQMDALCRNCFADLQKHKLGDVV